MNVGLYLHNYLTLNNNQPNRYITFDRPKPDCSLSFISCGGIEFSNTLMVCIWQPLKVPLIFKRLPASNNKWYAMHLTHWLNLKKGFWNRQPFVKAHWFQRLREGTDFQSKIQMACQAIMQSRFHLSIDAKTLNSSTFTNPLKPDVTYQCLWKLESYVLSVAELMLSLLFSTFMVWYDPQSYIWQYSAALPSLWASKLMICLLICSYDWDRRLTISQ